MVKRSLLTISILAAAAPVARAQTPDTPAPAAPAGDPYQKGTIGFAFPITLLSNVTDAFAVTSEPVPTVDILYFLDPKAAVDLIVGLNLHKEQITSNGVPPTTQDQTVFGLAAGVGYRMFKHAGNLHTFIEPELVIAWPDTGSTNSLVLRLAGDFGVERMLTEWMSLSGAIGAGVDAGNKFNDIRLATNATLAVNLYWK
jgi:hypothetical protein